MKKKKWCKFRHKVVTFIFRPVFMVLFFFKFLILLLVPSTLSTYIVDETSKISVFLKLVEPDTSVILAPNEFDTLVLPVLVPLVPKLNFTDHDGKTILLIVP